MIDRSDRAVAAAAIRSLGRSGDNGDTERFCAALLNDATRAAAADALAELGDPAVADAIAAADRGTGDLAAALAWLRDSRALPFAREQAALEIAAANRFRPWRDGLRGPAWMLARLGDDGDRAAMRAAAHSWQAVHLVNQAMSDELVPFTDALAATFPDARAPVEIAPADARTVPRMGLVELLEHPPADGGDPPAKFGGQPDWIGEPAWPIGSRGNPLTFYGQLPLAPVAEGMAYLFIGLDTAAIEDASWEAFSGANALVVQPGGDCHLPTARPVTGPELFEARTDLSCFRPFSWYEPYERFVALEPGLDPPRWRPATQFPEDADTVHDQPCDQRKIGGTPDWLQGEAWPSGDGWRFDFQFEASWAGREVADGAVFYGFVDDQRRGALQWQCH